ncbi:kinase-like domain-containing protein [Thelephora terrestris]|uniref:Kinase-like domain-containing protein n=1 Tax=Thelephora terrestris TaxID=56493 RepID=A0A9P6HKX4_9AGAM|nr:kinase-like domain-containing protein [Thelephora terrestris]
MAQLVGSGSAHVTRFSLSQRIIIELRRLCGHHLTVPTAYKLEGVEEEGDEAQSNSLVTEICKGRYNGGVVALKVLGVPQLRRRTGQCDLRNDPEVQAAKSRFCKEVVLMKQINHDNILPFYGVSTTVSDFCLVFPWYSNGNIKDYLKRKQDINRFNLLSGAVNGLQFLHGNRIVHGALRPSHILIDDDGNARLSYGGRGSIVAVPNTSIADHLQSTLDANDSNFRYVAPEVQWPETHGKEKVLITKESDIYEMAMTVYEVLSNNIPYSGFNENSALQKVQAGEIPGRPSEGINDQAWELLNKCWSRNPPGRPSTLELYNILSNLASNPQGTHTTQGQPAAGKLPEKLKLQVQSLRFSRDKSKTGQFYVKFRYGNMGHKTSPTNAANASGEHTWFGLRFISTCSTHG